MEARNRLRIAFAEVSAIAHATEDLAKVQRALENVLHGDLRGRVKLTRQYLRGHYGNPIVTIKGRIEGGEEAEALVRSIVDRLPEADRFILRRQLRERMDEDLNLFIRLDKQLAFLGKLGVRDDDPIRVKLKLLGPWAHPEEALAYAEGLFGDKPDG